ncbi:MAG: glycosyltransferase family 1 protein, partial [Methylotenera sp.]|nr:glycosyltransferase family 1 protein [Methylotenera sp.]
VEGLANCYNIDREIAVYTDADDLIEKIKFYLKHEALREGMAEAAYQRTIKEHTFAIRFNAVFKRMGLLNG